MKHSALRVACACLLMGVALAAAAGSIGAVFAEQEASAPLVTAAPVEPVSVFARVGLTSAKPGEKVYLYGTDGKLLQTLLTDAQASARTMLLEPGLYYACTENGCTAFAVEDNAAVAVRGGCGYSDGEQLHLEQGLVGTVRVEQLAGEEAAQVGWLDFVLTDGEYRRRAVVYCAEAGELLSCTFEGVPYGTYRLEESGRLLSTLTLSAETPQLSVSLP